MSNPLPSLVRPPQAARSEVRSKGEATRERILDHALALAGRLGLEGLTIGALADELGLSKSGLFAHFKSKEKLQLDVLDHAADEFRVRVFLPALAAPRGEARLRAIFGAWLDWVRSLETQGGCVFLAGALEWDDREGPVRESLVHWFEELSLGLQKAARLGIEAGELRRDLDLPQFAFDLHGIVLKYHLDARLLRSVKARGRAEHAFERLLDEARVAPLRRARPHPRKK